MIINMLVVFNCCLMVLITLKIIGFKKISQFFITLFFFYFLANCYQALLWSDPISFPEVQVILFSFSFI